jgi:inhibitor of KinA sporulation pathway (predicted exonuclease)
MNNKPEKALNDARNLAELVKSMIEDSNDLDLQRLLKQIEADLMDIQHKLTLASKLFAKG